MSKSQAVLIIGSFNPVTTAHIAMSSCARKEYPDADIMYIPVNQKYLYSYKGYSEKDIIPDEHRWEMLVGSLPPDCNALDIEMSGVVDGKTYNTVRFVASTYDEVIVCIGSDNLKAVSTWYRAEDLLQSTKFLVLQRAGCTFELTSDLQVYTSNFRHLKVDLPDVSSTQVRNAIHNGADGFVRCAVPPYVYRYLTQHPELYKEICT